jgi:hypothetical protein
MQPTIAPPAMNPAEVPLLDPDNYISSGDDIIAVPKSTSVGDVVRGRVLAVGAGEPGRREFIVELEGQDFTDQGAYGLPERLYVFSVRRGDGWVLVPGYLLPEEAEAKLARASGNTRKRIERDVPLFADQIDVEFVSVDEYIENHNKGRRADLQRSHDQAKKSTDLREEVRAMVSPVDFAQLQHERSRYPKDGIYGAYFWRTQLEHIALHCRPDIFVPTAPLTERLQLPWLTSGAELTWPEAPGGPKKVHVLYIGSNSVLVKLAGEAITDYDAKHFPYGNTWLPPAAFAEHRAA